MRALRLLASFSFLLFSACNGVSPKTQKGSLGLSPQITLGGPSVTAGGLSFGTINARDVASTKLTISNIGSGDVALYGSGYPQLTAPFSYLDGAYPGTGGDCAAVLPANSSCSVVLAFSSADRGQFQSTFTLGYGLGDLVSSTSQTLTATSIALDGLSLPNALDFPNTSVGASANLPFTVVNQTGTTVTVLGTVQKAGVDSQFQVGMGTCGTLQPGASCVLTIKFAPDYPGNFSQTLGVKYQVGNNVRYKSLQMKGIAPGLAISDERLVVLRPKFEIGSHTYTVTNVAGGTASSVIVELQPLSASDLTYIFGSQSQYVNSTGLTLDAGTCTGSLAPGASCQFTVTDNSFGIDGNEIIVGYAIGSESMISTALIYGDSTSIAWGPPSLPSLQISDDTSYGFFFYAQAIQQIPNYDFGEPAPGVTVSHVVTLQNPTSQNVSWPLIDGGLPSPFTLDWGNYTATYCFGELAPGESCQFTVDFAPSSSSSGASSGASLEFGSASTPIAELTFSGALQ